MARTPITTPVLLVIIVCLLSILYGQKVLCGGVEEQGIVHRPGLMVSVGGLSNSIADDDHVHVDNQLLKKRMLESESSSMGIGNNIGKFTRMFIDETASYVNSSCNITYPCTSFRQAIDYLVSLDSGTMATIIVLEFSVSSDITICENNWRSELNPMLEVFVNSYPKSMMRTISCGGKRFYSLDKDSQTKLRIHFDGFHFKNINFIHDKGSLVMNDCVTSNVVVKCNFGELIIRQTSLYNSEVRFYESNFYTSNSYYNNTVISGVNTIGSATIFAVQIIDTIFHRVTFTAMSFRLTIQYLSALESMIKFNSAPSVSISNSTFTNVKIQMLVVNRLDMNTFEIKDNTEPVLLSGINIAVITNGTVRNCTVSTDGAIAFRTVLSLGIDNSRFIGNRRGIFADNIITFVVQNCEFSNNYQAISLQNFDFNSRGTASFYGCVFYDNFYTEGNGGAFQMLSDDSLRFVNCKFKNNYARNGGAIYSTSETVIESTIFQNNSAIVIQDCTEITCGNGGCLYTKGILHLEDVEFYENTAMKGGACYLDTIQDCFLLGFMLFRDNVASFTGSDFFLYDTYANLTSNTRFTQSNIGKLSVIPKYPYNDGIKLPENGHLSLYPGQSISFNFELFDTYGNQIKKVQSSPRFLVSINKEVVVKTLINITTNLTLNSFSYEVNQQIPTSMFQVGIVFGENFKTHTLNVQPLPCPFGYSLKKQYESEFSQLVCIREQYEAIIASSVMGSVLILIVLCGCSIGAYIIGSKLRNLNNREKAERSLAKKLIEKQFIFGTDSELTESLLISTGKTKQLKSQCDNMIIPVSDIEIISKIGEGSNGVVYKARWNGTPVALKTLKIEESDEFEHEATLLSSLKHPSIVTFYGISVGVNVKYMIVEFMPNGSLDNLIRECKSGRVFLSMKQKIGIVLGVANGLLYLHNLKPLSIIHRDVKSGNVLLDSNYQAKVTDFGLSKLTSNTNSSTMTANLGTYFYMAPELISEGEFKISRKLDVYSFAIIMYELFFEEPPYGCTNSPKLDRFRKEEKEMKNLICIPYLVAKGERPKIPFTNQEEQSIWISEFMKEKDLDDKSLCKVVTAYIELMKSCWSQDPEKRPTFDKVVVTLSTLLSGWK